MLGFMTSPGNKGSKPSLVHVGSSGYNPFDSDSGSRDTSRCNYNPFDSDSDSDTATSKNQNPVTRKQTSVETVLIAPDFATPDRKRSDSGGSDDVENQSLQGLENHAVHKAEKTTLTVRKCLKIAEDIRGDAVRTLEMLHHQGQQIMRTHHVAVDVDKDLTRGEKLLGSLGTMFSRTWKPNKGRDITGPLTMSDDKLSNGQHNKEQRENLGVTPVPKIKSASRTPPPDPANVFNKVQLEKDRQDDVLSDLSNILGDLKNMALEMGSEIERQNKALDHLGGDVDELNFRVKGANQRTRRLLGD